MTWKKLKGILLNERGQYVKTTYYMILIMVHSGNGKTMETVKSLGVGRDQERGKKK